MNKLEAISKRSYRARAVVKLIKAAITGVCACALIASSTRLGIGYVTYALEDDYDRRTDMYSSPLTAAAAAVSRPARVLDEDALSALFPPAVPEYERPSLSRPDGYSGALVELDENNDVLLYGEHIASMTGKAEADKLSASGTPAEGEAVETSYFDDAVVIGNSLVVGMQKSGVLSNVRYYANIGLSVKDFFTKACFIAPDGATNTDGSALRVSAAEALLRDDSFKKVYLMFGINELGWAGTGGFISFYSDVIDTVLSIRPDAVIYVQAIMPINEEMYREGENAYDFYTNERIATFNAALKRMAEKKNVIFLTPGEIAEDASGGLRADATIDGVHLNTRFIKQWKAYLETHTVSDVDLKLFYEEVK